jgi:hypothetical protein
MKSIASKFNLLTIFLITLTAFLVAGYLIWLHQLSTFRNFAQHGEEIVIMLAKNIEYGVYTESKKDIDHSLQGLDQNPDIAYLTVCNRDLKVLSERNYRKISSVPQLLKTPDLLGDKKITTDHYIDKKNNKNYINIIAPVYLRPGTG